MSTGKPLIVGLGGTTRSGSSSEKLLRFALCAAQEAGARTELFAGPALDFPMYAPDVAARPPAALQLIAALRRCDGVILASPGYHGTISGLLKNALDYIEDMSRDGEPYLQGRAVGAITCAFGWQAAVTTLGSLRSIVHALRGWPTPLGVCANSGQPLFDGHGRLLDPDIRQKLRILADEVVGFARVRSQARAFDVRAERAASLAA